MAKIIKVASSTSTPRIANQFKTSRNSTTNPFKYQNFEGNTLDVSAFADVFESSAAKDTNRIKLIAASVAGSMHKIATGITEPIIRFVSRVCENVTSAWDYARNTNISDLSYVKGINSRLKAFGEFMSKPIELPGGQIISGIKSHLDDISSSAIDYGKEISSKWSDLISRIHSSRKISADMSVSELEELWKAEILSSSTEEVA